MSRKSQLLIHSDVMDIHAIMSGLARDRTVFHSEADLQHAVAWRIHSQHPDATIRLERPFEKAGRRRLDIWVALDAIRIGIELKYPKACLRCTIDGESFSLPQQNVPALNCYDFLLDVHRLETLARDGFIDVGFAVMLTNEPALWSPTAKPSSTHTGFVIAQGSKLTGTLAWKRPEKETKDRQLPIVLLGEYACAWQNYSSICGERFGSFKYLIMEVDGVRGTYAMVRRS